jgi:hypothetical protein
MIRRRVGIALSLALVLQVVLAGWMAPCRVVAAALSDSSTAGHHHDGTPTRDDGEQLAAGCMATSACTVVMVAAKGVLSAPRVAPFQLVEAPAGGWSSIAVAPELPPPRG